MHFCANPLEVLNHYSLIGIDGKMNRFAEVEALDEALTRDNKKYCTKKLKIGAELSLKGFIKDSFDFLWDKCYEEPNDSEADNSKLASSGDNSKLASSGYYSKLASSGNNSKLASSGYYSQLASSGDNSRMAIEGKNSAGACLGRNSKIKGKIGTWITLASYDEKGVINCVKSAQIDGTELKEDVFYRLKDGEFVEVEED